MAYYVDNYENVTTKKYKEEVKAKGIKMVTFTPEQVAKLNELAASVREDWVKKYAEDFDSRALFDYTEALFSEKGK